MSSLPEQQSQGKLSDLEFLKAVLGVLVLRAHKGEVTISQADLDQICEYRLLEGFAGVKFALKVEKKATRH